jgi:soluble lytic murein transglycosylase-like protein
LQSNLKTLLLVVCLSPALLTGCETTQNDTSASFQMAPTDIALPETVAVVPTLERRGAEAAATIEANGAAGVQTASVAGVAAPAAGEVSSNDASQTTSAAEKAAGEGDMPVMAMAAAGPASKMPLSKPKAANASSDQPVFDTAVPKAVPTEVEGVVVKTLAKASDVVEAALTPATYLKGDSPRGRVDELISKYASLYEVPVDLVRRVVKRESNYNPGAFNRGHYGLMQIKQATARGMGYQGPAKGLFDADTNLKYSVKYLRGAYMVANGNHDRADRLYQSGYYYHAKRMGLLDETGLGTDRMRRRAKLPES